jgi:simple sugar transport system permease protein
VRRIIKYQEFYLFLIIVVLSAFITLINPNFLTLENMFDLLKSYSFYGIMAMGMLFVLVSGGIDMSFAAIATVSEYLMAVFMMKYGGNIFVCFLIAALVGSALGFINGLLIGKFRIPSIIATIATMNIFYGLLVIFTGGKWIHSMPEWFRSFAMVQVFSFANADGALYGLSIITLIWFLVMLVAIFILRFTLFGRGIYAMGGDRKSAVRVGFNVEATEILVYTFMGLLSGIAGVVQGLLVQTVAPNSIVGKELNIIAAVVLGGASLAGGRGSVPGVFLGLVLLAIVKNGMTLMAIPPVWYEFFVGVVILLSIGATSYQAKRERRQVGTIRTLTAESKK